MISIAAESENSGRIARDVDISVSGPGLTLATATVFGPALIVIAAAGYLNGQGYSGGSFAVTGLVALLIALLLGATCGRKLAAGLLDLKLEAANKKTCLTAVNAVATGNPRDRNRDRLE